MFTQLGRYKLPDQQLKQDIVMAFIMSGGWLEHRLYGYEQAEEEEELEGIIQSGSRYDSVTEGRSNTELVSRW